MNASRPMSTVHATFCRLKVIRIRHSFIANPLVDRMFHSEPFARLKSTTAETNLKELTEEGKIKWMDGLIWDVTNVFEASNERYHFCQRAKNLAVPGINPKILRNAVKKVRLDTLSSNGLLKMTGDLTSLYYREEWQRLQLEVIHQTVDEEWLRRFLNRSKGQETRQDYITACHLFLKIWWVRINAKKVKWSKFAQELTSTFLAHPQVVESLSTDEFVFLMRLHSTPRPQHLPSGTKIDRERTVPSHIDLKLSEVLPEVNFHESGMLAQALYLQHQRLTLSNQKIAELFLDQIIQNGQEKSLPEKTVGRHFKLVSKMGYLNFEKMVTIRDLYEPHLRQLAPANLARVLRALLCVKGAEDFGAKVAQACEGRLHKIYKLRILEGLLYSFYMLNIGGENKAVRSIAEAVVNEERKKKHPMDWLHVTKIVCFLSRMGIVLKPEMAKVIFRLNDRTDDFVRYKKDPTKRWPGLWK